MRKVTCIIAIPVLLTLVIPANSVFAGLGEPLATEDNSSPAVEQIKTLIAKLTPEQAAAFQQHLSRYGLEAGSNRFDELIGKLFILFFLFLAVSLIIMAFS